MPRVTVYRNLNRQCWSITAVSGNRGRGKLISHCTETALTAVTFVAHATTADRIRRTFAETGRRERNVHAWVVGDAAPIAPTSADLTEVTFNPYRRNEFHTRDGRSITSADYVLFASDGKAYCRNPR